MPRSGVPQGIGLLMTGSVEELAGLGIQKLVQGCYDRASNQLPEVLFDLLLIEDDIVKLYDTHGLKVAAFPG